MVQKAEITCSSIKYCVKIMSRLLVFIEGENNNKYINYTNLLVKNKLFLKLTRLIIKNCEEALKFSNEKQKEFFDM